jgi:hypothetical protein
MRMIGNGYGSEHHLRTLMASRNHNFELSLLNLIRADPSSRINWHPNYQAMNGLEIRGVDFLPDTFAVNWKAYWPDPRAWASLDRPGIHNWDGIGTISDARDTEWLLLEAKAHLGELQNSPKCGAGESSRALIKRAFQKTRFAMGLTDSIEADVPESWFCAGGYQIANRLAALNFLLFQSPVQNAHLIFIYFVGARFPGITCPRDESEWRGVLQAKYADMGISAEHAFSSRVHHIFPNYELLTGATPDILEGR